jgi:hypothetical protein
LVLKTGAGHWEQTVCHDSAQESYAGYISDDESQKLSNLESGMKLLDYLLSHPGEDEKENFSPNIVTSVTSVTTQLYRANKPVESTPVTDDWGPPLGRKNHRGDLVLTIEDIPDLERRLRLSGWKVRRIGNGLICRTGSRTQ